MYSETFLEVLGADLGVQDLLCHGTGEPASLLVMQSLTKDPPCKEVSRVRSSTGAGAGDKAGASSRIEPISGVQPFQRAVAWHPT